MFWREEGIMRGSGFWNCVPRLRWVREGGRGGRGESNKKPNARWVREGGSETTEPPKHSPKVRWVTEGGRFSMGGGLWRDPGEYIRWVIEEERDL